MSKERRIEYDNNDIEILNRLMASEPFKNIQHIDFFALCLIYGKKAGFKTPLNSKKKGRIRENTISKNLKYLMMAVAVEDTGELEILSNKNKYFRICEEYAKTGLHILEKEYFNNPDILDNLEFEAIQYYDKYIDKS